VDVHCHCLPNLDDGPESMEEAIALCRVLAADNVSTVVATPHQLGRFEDRTKAGAIRRTVGALNRALGERGIDLTILPGAEVRVDERIDELLACGEILTLADAGCHVLLELPWDALIDIEPLLAQFTLRGVQTILAHPERNGPLLERPQMLGRWTASGVGLQVTAGSHGDWGRLCRTGRLGIGGARRAGLHRDGRARWLAVPRHDQSLRSRGGPLGQRSGLFALRGEPGAGDPRREARPRFHRNRWEGG
jgi:tyrosine-protein phosphatase YwqE